MRGLMKPQDAPRCTCGKPAAWVHDGVDRCYGCAVAHMRSTGKLPAQPFWVPSGFSSPVEAVPGEFQKPVKP